jgi:hypothetical protein
MDKPLSTNGIGRARVFLDGPLFVFCEHFLFGICEHVIYSPYTAQLVRRWRQRAQSHPFRQRFSR